MKSKFRVLLVAATLTLGLLPLGAAADGYVWDTTGSNDGPAWVTYTAPPGSDQGDDHYTRGDKGPGAQSPDDNSMPAKGGLN